MGDPLVDEIERRAAEDNKKVEGANYPEIIKAVAQENDCDHDALIDRCRKQWSGLE